MAGIELSSEDEAFDKPDDWDYWGHWLTTDTIVRYLSNQCI
jgi:hypothetical protein